MNIAGLPRQKVLMALYDRARQLVSSYLHYRPEPLTWEEADALLKETDYLAYLHGRVLRVSIGASDEVDTFFYNFCNGPGAAEDAVGALRAELGVPDDQGSGEGEQGHDVNQD